MTLRPSFSLGLAMVVAVLGGPVTREAEAGEAAGSNPRWDRGALEYALVYAQRQRSSAVIVVDHGASIAERYWTVDAASGSAYASMLWGKTATGAPVEDVASLQKSVVSLLVGIAGDQGLLDLDAQVSRYLHAGWSNATCAEESAITIRHLLSMSSGLSPALEYRAPAGEVWQYNTRAYSRIVDVLEVVTGEGIGPLTARWLTEPTGMVDTAWRRRPWVTLVMDANPIGLYATARDLARLGELILARGDWHGRRVVSEAFIAAAVAPSQTLNPAYGLLWWLNVKPMRGEPEASDHAALAAAAPGDMVAAQGALGRKVYVVPSLELVVVRLGDAPDADFNQRFWELLMEAAPAAPIRRAGATPVAGRCSQARGD
jgi:CubicO group peptidase (beta-lactamase class C family)